MTPPSLKTRILVGTALRSQPDRRLVALAREGHLPAIEEAARRYRTELVQYAATIVPADRADDVVQDSITKALPSIRGGDDELQLRPWLYAIVRNTALNNLRDAGPRLEHLDEQIDRVEQPPEAFERQEDLRDIVARMNELPLLQRDALVKREMEGMSHSEIGGALGVTVAAARQLIHRGRSTLRTGIGALIPMPILRQLVEGVDGSGVAMGTATATGGVIATKAAIVLIAAGGVMTAGVALNRHAHDPADARTVAAGKTTPAVGGDNPTSAIALAGGSGSSARGSGPGRGSDIKGGSAGTDGSSGDSSSNLTVGGTPGTSKSDDGSAGQGTNSGSGGGEHQGSGSGHHPPAADDGHHTGPAVSGNGGSGGSEGDDSGESGDSHSGSGGKAPSGSGTVAKPPPASKSPEKIDAESGSGPSVSSGSTHHEDNSDPVRDLGDSLGFQ